LFVENVLQNRAHSRIVDKVDQLWIKEENNTENSEDTTQAIQDSTQKKMETAESTTHMV